MQVSVIETPRPQRLPRAPGLVSGPEVALEHQPHDGAVAGEQLPQDVAADGGLAGVVLLRVAVGAVDHDRPCDALARHTSQCLLDARGVVVGAVASAAQDQVQVGVARGAHHRRAAVDADPQEAVRVARRDHGVVGDVQAAIGSVLEADGHGEAAGKLPVGLALAGAGSDGGPGEQVRHELRHEGVEQLAGAGQGQLVDLQQQPACQRQAGGHVAALVEVRVVYEPLPAHGGAGLFEVGAHHHADLAA